jgi:hypothetical protein
MAEGICASASRPSTAAGALKSRIMRSVLRPNGACGMQRRRSWAAFVDRMGRSGEGEVGGSRDWCGVDLRANARRAGGILVAVECAITPKSQQSENGRNGERGFCVGRVVKEYKCRQWLGAEEIGYT